MWTPSVTVGQQGSSSGLTSKVCAAISLPYNSAFEKRDAAGDIIVKAAQEGTQPVS